VTAHLKSRNATPEADASELRLEEARLLRARIDTLFAANPNTNLIVLGDFNDSPESAVVTNIIGHGGHRLIDTCPVEHNGAGFHVGSSVSASGKGAWTNFFREKGEYSRFDYILVSPAMAPSLTAGGSFVLDAPNWATASDHRPVLASICTR
jgi:endonuclease/exonuclease/phosphatase family metal-dependent hydrolase